MTKSIYKSYEDATRHYYGADNNLLKLVPVVTDNDVAHIIALQVNERLGKISEDELTKSALRLQARNRLSRTEVELDVLKDEVLKDQLNRIVVNAELTHARELPQDFHEDAMNSGAYQMGTGIIIAPLPNPDDLRQ